MQNYNFVKKKQKNKKDKEPDKIMVRCHRFHSYFHDMICTKNCY